MVALLEVLVVTKKPHIDHTAERRYSRLDAQRIFSTLLYAYKANDRDDRRIRIYTETIYDVQARPGFIAAGMH